MNDNNRGANVDAADRSPAAAGKPPGVLPGHSDHAGFLHADFGRVLGPDMVDQNGALISLNPDYHFLDVPVNAGK